MRPGRTSKDVSSTAAITQPCTTVTVTTDKFVTIANKATVFVYGTVTVDIKASQVTTVSGNFASDAFTIACTTYEGASAPTNPITLGLSLATNQPAATLLPCPKSTGVAVQQTTTSSRRACSTDIRATNQYLQPDHIVSVDSNRPDTAMGDTMPKVKLSPRTPAIFNFEVPKSYPVGHSCSFMFLFPSQTFAKQNATFTGDGKVQFAQLDTPADENLTFNNIPSSQLLGNFTMKVGENMVVSTETCVPGQTMSFMMTALDNTVMEYVNDDGPSPMGAFISTCASTLTRFRRNLPLFR